MTRPSPCLITRRRLLANASAAGLTTVSGGIAFPSLSRAASRPVITHGLQSGDVSTNSGVVWARVDRASRVFFDVASDASFKRITKTVAELSRVRPPASRDEPGVKLKRGK
jgi:alkaline phosphatase D